MADNFKDLLIMPPDLSKATEIMKKLLEDRDVIPESRDAWLRFPVAMYFIRGDRGGAGKELSEETMASLNYWHLDSGEYIDILLPGWERRWGDVKFDTEMFYKFKVEIESLSKWRFCGESEILLVNYDYSPWEHEGRFRFNETMSLPVEQMIEKGITTSVDALMNEIISVAKETEKGSVWEMSDALGYQRARKSLWEYLKIKISGDLAKIYNELRPFAVCDLDLDA